MFFSLPFAQIYSHYHGVLVLPCRGRHSLLLHWTRVSAAQHLRLHQAKDQGASSLLPPLSDNGVFFKDQRALVFYRIKGANRLIPLAHQRPINHVDKF